MMDKRIKIYGISIVLLLFIALPMLTYGLGYFPRRSFLKEAISVITLLGFFFMLLQFFLSRANQSMLKGYKFARILKWHKVLGYVFIGVLFFHPVLIVLPRLFEAGIDPGDAFSTLLAEWKSKQLLLGIIAWFLMIVLGLTSIFRNNLGMSYKNWRLLHGWLSIAFIVSATLHSIQIGRHMSVLMVSLILLLTVISVVLMLNQYIYKSSFLKNKSNE